MIQITQEMRKDSTYKMKSIIRLILILILSLALYPAFAGGTPEIVAITSTNCSSCKILESVLDDLENSYNGRVAFLRLYVSSKSSIEEAREKAEEFGITKFFEDNKAIVPTVGILCPGSAKAENIFIGETRKEVYEEALNKLLEDTEKLCSL